MTDWLDWPSYRRLGSLLRAPEGGAAEIGSHAATDLADFVEALNRYAPECYPAAIEAIADEIVERQPALAPLVALANAVLLAIEDGPAVVAAEARGFQKRLAASLEILSTVGAALIPEGGSVLTYGGSSSVRAALGVARDKGIRVVCSASSGSGEGHLMAADLNSTGLTVEVVDDSMVLEALYAVDLVLVGANALGPDAAVTVAGTGALAKEASNRGVHAVVLASADKALPTPLFDRASAAALVSPMLEVVRLVSFDSIVTELGVLDADGVRRLADAKVVAARLA
ncbi:MAG: hypothetical protein WD184_08945 [Acidimicrobiia bacterium]